MTPSLTTIVRRALDPRTGEARLPKGATLLVATSGGPDSMALLSVLARLAPRLGLDVRAHGVDHGLRPEAVAELDLAEQLARRVGVPWERTCVTVPPGGNLQERARLARWGALTTAARRLGAAVATGHHADDRAETLLLRLLRGAGLRGLAVLPPRALAPGAPDVTAIRPLLRARRSDVLLHLSRHGIRSSADPSNDNARFLRTSIRDRILPLLQELDPNIVTHLSAIADEIAGPTATAEAQGSGMGWSAGLPRPTQEALRTLLSSGSREARVWLPGGLVVRLDPRARESTTPCGKGEHTSSRGDPGRLPLPQAREASDTPEGRGRKTQASARRDSPRD